MTTTSTASPNDDNDKYKDETLLHVWFKEPTPVQGGVLTSAGLEHIARYQYTPGDYTALDVWLNPYWTKLTELLPLTLAPNMVTTLGGLHCGLAYSVTWYYSTHLVNDPIPWWLPLLNGYCTIAYYTLDCMDGKQARRTSTSSPLGQLFDHGFDCICNLAHVSSVAAYLLSFPSQQSTTTSMIWSNQIWYLVIQVSLQFAFFAAQWEEYYTHVLPHSTGNIGVTEVNYGLALLSIANAFMDREAFWTTPIRLGGSLTLELRHLLLVGWCCMTTVLLLLSFQRVYKYIAKTYPNNSGKIFGCAMLKLTSPIVLGIIPFCFLPSSLLEYQLRQVSLVVGLLYSILTKKMIVFSMAKCAFAVVQMDVVVPLVVVVVITNNREWFGLDHNSNDNTTTYNKWIWSSMCLWYAYRLLRWANLCIQQICQRLDIYCFTIKKKTTHKVE